MHIFTKAFVENVIRDGFIDTSRLETERFIPRQQKESLDTNRIAHVGDQFVITMQVHRPVSNRTVEVTLIDSLPSGLRMVDNTVRSIAGIDTLHHSRVIVAKCSLNEPISSLSFCAEITRDGEISKLVNHQFYVVRKDNKGTIVVDKVNPMVIEVVKKNR